MAQLRLTGGYIPIKKLVFDIQKGSFLRTYYVKPEYLTKIRQEFIKGTYQYIKSSELNRTYENLKKSNDYSVLTQHIKDVNVLDTLASNFHLQERIATLNPAHNQYRLIGSIVNYILTDNESYLKGIATIASRATKLYTIKWTTRNKSTGTQEKRVTSNDNAVEYIPQFVKIERPNIIARKISSLLSFLRPTELKLTKILEKLIANNFKDDNYILHNLILTPNINYPDNEVLERIIRSIIVQKYRIIFGIVSDEKAYEFIDDRWFTYNYLLLSNKSRNEIMQVYPNPDVNKLLNINTFEQLVNTNFMHKDTIYSYLVLSPTSFFKSNFSKLVSYITEIQKQEEKLSTIQLIISRKDIPYQAVGHILEQFKTKVDEITLSSNLENILINALIAKQKNVVYIPYTYLLNEINPFKSSFLFKLLQYILQTKYNEYIDKINRSKDLVSSMKLYYNVPEYIQHYIYMLGDTLPIILHLEPLVKVTTEPISTQYIELDYKGTIYKFTDGMYIPVEEFLNNVR